MHVSHNCGSINPRCAFLNVDGRGCLLHSHAEHRCSFPLIKARWETFPNMGPPKGDALSALEGLLDVDDTSRKHVGFEADSSTAYVDTWSGSTKFDDSIIAVSRTHSWDTVDSDLKGLGSFFDNNKPLPTLPADPQLILSPSGGGNPRLLGPLVIPSQESKISDPGIGKLHVLSQP